jgi:RHS repeat-associated protein
VGLGGCRDRRRDCSCDVRGGPTAAQLRCHVSGAGRLKEFDYPQCLSGCSGLPDRTITQEFMFGRLKSISETSGSPVTLASNFTYHPSGMLNAFQHGNGIVYTQSQDTSGRLRPLTIGALGTNVNWTTGSYAYDPSGNIKSIGNKFFTYDALSRLTRFERTGAQPVAETYEYDRVGNLRVLGNHNIPIDNDTKTNQLTVGTYTKAGSLKQHPDLGSLSWDAFQNLATVTSDTTQTQTVHAYDASDERVWSWQAPTSTPNTRSNETFTLRGGDGKVLRELVRPTAASALGYQDYVYRDGQLLASYKSAVASPQHFDLDHLGSVALVTGPTGGKVSEKEFLPYGQTNFPDVAAQDNTEQMRFTGHERDLGVTTGANAEADDLDYMHARYYRPLWGRFLSVDPVSGTATLPQTWNRYSYVRSNPVRLTDPTGRCAWDLCVIEAAAAWEVGTAVAVAFGIVQQRMTRQAELFEAALILMTAAQLADATPVADELYDVPRTDGEWFPDRSLPRTKDGVPIPDRNEDGTTAPHTQLGKRDGEKGKYPQAREFDETGQPVRDIDFTDHGRPDQHPKPHQHRYKDNPTGGTRERGDAEPVRPVDPPKSATK